MGVRLFGCILGILFGLKYLSAQELEIPNGGFEFVGPYYPALKSEHPLGWSSNHYKNLQEKGIPLLRIERDNPFEGKNAVVLM